MKILLRLVAPHNENPSMTELTIDQALQQGIEAHKAGRVQDADFAQETGNLAKNQILQQAATAMVAQANASKSTILALVRG